MTNSKIIGVLYKEYLLLQQSLGQYTFLLCFYWCGSLLGLYSLEMAVSVGQMLFLFAPFALFRREEEQNLQKYMVLLGTKEMVTGRYLFALVLCGLVTMLNLLFLVFCQIFTQKSTESPLIVLFFSSIFGIFLLTLSFPLFYAYETKKAKPWFYLLLLVPSILIVIFYQNITFCINFIWEKAGILALVGLLLILLGSVLALGLFSLQKSILLQQKKDFS